MTTKREKAQAREEAIANLRSMLPPGSTVYTILRHVSRSGMMRRVSLSAIIDGLPHDLDGRAALACGWTWDRDNGGIRVSGCGMDMGFHLVSTLSRVLYPDGFGCIGERCMSNDHSNGDRDYRPHSCNADRSESGNVYSSHHKHDGAPVRSGKYGVCHWHSAGDYALRHRWI